MTTIKKPKRPFLQIAFLLVMGIIITLAGFAEEDLAKEDKTEGKPVIVGVDFAKPFQAKSMSGFLHSLGMDPSLPNDVVAPLKPAWWRLDPTNKKGYEQAVALGAKVQLVLSDAYGYPSNNWKGHGPPWAQHWKNWDAHVRQTARAYKGKPVYWDVWNEPDAYEWNHSHFWNGTQAQYFEAYRRTYRILRRELGPNVPMVGPSYANYDEKELSDFLRFANQNHLQVNYLSWHELGEADANIAAIPVHIVKMKKLAASYPRLRTKGVLINESVGPKSHVAPGEIVAYLAFLEKGGADGSNKGCWDASDKSNNCFNGGLDGLLTPKTMQPTSVWWVYKTYADGVASRVKTSSGSPNIMALGSASPVTVLLGYFGHTDLADQPVQLDLKNLPHPENGQPIKLSLYELPAQGEEPFSEPRFVQQFTAPVNGTSATIQLTPLKLHHAYQVRLVLD